MIGYHSKTMTKFILTDQHLSHGGIMVSEALETGDHPSVSDNFQSGIPATGNMLLARSQDDLVAMFIWRLSDGDLAYSDARTGERVHTLHS